MDMPQIAAPRSQFGSSDGPDGEEPLTFRALNPFYQDQQ